MYEEYCSFKQQMDQIKEMIMKTIKDEIDNVRIENIEFKESVRLKFEEQKDFNDKIVK